MSAHAEQRPEPGPSAPGVTSTPSGPLTQHDPIEPRRDAPAPPSSRTVSDLAEHLVELAGTPIDVWAIAALLESIGVRDLDARERYRMRDVFELAEAVARELPPAPPEHREEEVEPLPVRLKNFARYYGRGTFFFVPLALQMFALLAFGISQYASLEFTLRDASVLAAAAALSFLVTSGFTQALGYLGPMYSETGKHMLAEKVSWTIVALGVAASVLAGLLAWAVCVATDAYPARDLRVGGLYYILLSLQGLVSALLYMLHRYLAMVLATIAALALAGVLYAQTSLPVEVIHWISLGVGFATEFTVALVVLRRRARNTRGDLRLAALPRFRILLKRVTPFALYGLLYFAFLTVDRTIAWTTGDDPLPVWFHPAYELGLDWALTGIVLALAFLEVSIEGFSKLLEPASERYGINSARQHNREIMGFWTRQLAWVATIAAFGTWLSLGSAVALNELGWLGPAQVVYDDAITRYVYGFSLIGYTLLALGIANSVFVMSLNRPWRAIVPVAAGVVVSLVVGLVATSIWAYWTAVFGMVAGAAVFAAISTWQAWRTLRRTDYFNFAAW